MKSNGFPCYDTQRDCILAEALIALDKDLIGTKGTITIEADHLFNGLKVESGKTNAIAKNTAIGNGQVTLTGQIDSRGFSFNMKKKADFLRMDNKTVLCAHEIEGEGYVAIRYRVDHHADGTIRLNGYYAQVRQYSAYEIFSFSCDVTESNISE